jgi:hypothetical protein
MSTQTLFNTIQNSEISQWIGKQDHLLGAFAELLHIVGLILVLSSILIISLRLLGLGLRKQSPSELVAATSRFIWVGLFLLLISGLILFLPAANNYYPNDIFWLKFKILAIALIVHLTIFREVTSRTNGNAIVAKFTGIAALGLWFGVAFSGRFIGFF